MANDALVTAAQSAPVRVQGIDIDKVPPDVLARAASIMFDVQSTGGTITPAQAITAAYHFKETGDVMGRDSYVGTKGQVAGRVIQGYQGLARERNMALYQWQFRDMTPEEKSLHGVQEGDKTLICELTVLAARRQCIDMKIEYRPVLGMTIVRKSDMQSVPKNRTLRWVLEKQCKNDALRQVGEHTSADDVLAEAGVEAPEGVHLTIEQAEAWVRSLAAAAQVAALPEAEQQKRLAANTDAMRGPKTDDPLGVDEQPKGKILDNEAWHPDNEAAQKYVDQVNPSEPSCPICGGPMWDNRERVAKALAENKKPGPEWACKAGKWNAQTRETDGCQGKYWKGEWPVKTDAPSDELMQKLLDLGKQIYNTPETRKHGKAWLTERYDVDFGKATSISEMLKKLDANMASDCVMQFEAMIAQLEALNADESIGA